MKEAGVTYTELVRRFRGSWLCRNRSLDRHEAQAGNVRGDVPTRLPCGFGDGRDTVGRPLGLCNHTPSTRNFLAFLKRLSVFCRYIVDQVIYFLPTEFMIVCVSC